MDDFSFDERLDWKERIDGKACGLLKNRGCDMGLFARRLSHRRSVVVGIELQKDWKS